MEPLTGDDPVQVGGYQVRARLGAGGMGRVYLAFTAGGRPVALKVIRPELGDDPDFRSRFRQEVEAARRVHGLYTAQVLDANIDASPPWLVTAYVPGPSLHQAVSEHGPLPLDTALLLMAGVAEALQAVHGAGLVHRDLKPSNVLLAPDGPRVIDFGIARAIEATTVTRTGLRVGSPPFMAPEQVQGVPVTPATDVFALGSVVAFAMTGQLPFGAGNEQAMLYRVVHQEPDLSGCPETLRALIVRCLAKAPAERPSPAELITECRARSAGQTLQVAQSWLPAAVSADLAQHVPPTPPAGAMPPGMPPPAMMPPRPTARLDTGWTASRGPAIRRPLVIGVVAVAIVTLVGVGAALGVALGSHGASGSPSGASGNRAAPGATTTAQAAGTATASSSNPATCLIGTWQTVNQQITTNATGQPMTFTGSGAVSTLRTDGTISSTYDNERLRSSTTASSPQYTIVIQGTATAHWTVDNDQISYSEISSNGTESLYLGGFLVTSLPLSLTPSTASYQCSGNTFHETFADGETDQLARVTPP